jgi:hypothetical protein
LASATHSATSRSFYFGNCPTSGFENFSIVLLLRFSSTFEVGGDLESEELSSLFKRQHHRLVGVHSIGRYGLAADFGELAYRSQLTLRRQRRPHDTDRGSSLNLGDGFIEQNYNLKTCKTLGLVGMKPFKFERVTCAT